MGLQDKGREAARKAKEQAEGMTDKARQAAGGMTERSRDTREQDQDRDRSRENNPAPEHTDRAHEASEQAREHFDR